MKMEDAVKVNPNIAIVSLVLMLVCGRALLCRRRILRKDNLRKKKGKKDRRE